MYYPASLFEQGKERFLTILHRYMEIHGTVYFETQRPPEVPAFVKNHGLLPQQELQQLLRRAKVSDTGAPLSGVQSSCLTLTNIYIAVFMHLISCSVKVVIC